MRRGLRGHEVVHHRDAPVVGRDQGVAAMAVLSGEYLPAAFGIAGGVEGAQREEVSVDVDNVLLTHLGNREIAGGQGSP